MAYKTSKEANDKKFVKAHAAVVSGTSVLEACQKYKLDKSAYYSRLPKSGKQKRKKREEKPMTITEIKPVAIQTAGGKTVLIITDDRELIESVLGRYA